MSHTKMDSIQMYHYSHKNRVALGQSVLIKSTHDKNQLCLVWVSHEPEVLRTYWWFFWQCIYQLWYTVMALKLLTLLNDANIVHIAHG